MPRVNIETSVWSDARFQRLMITIGDRHRAIGVIVDLWILAQQFWFPDKKLIPVEAWTIASLPEALVECGLVDDRRPEGYYAKGAEKHFNWWFEGMVQRRDAGKRRASTGQRDSSGRWVAGQSTNALTSERQPSPSTSSSVSSSKKAQLDTLKIWEFYSNALKGRGIQAIDQGAKTKRICNQLLELHGFETTKRLVHAYVNDSDKFLKDKAYPLALLHSQLQTYLAKIHALEKAPLDFGSDV
ncbi:MAG: hypothetical protein NW224_26885 [Leptolyngbyaceae cyanobacterium bins.302]|nr:hypothetical protein [Leptolyngbyaceae cyanobacterium bins.302]